MIISLLLLIYDFSDAQVAKVSILGTEFVAGKPWVLVITAWAIWGYFLLRYYQYFKSEEDNTVGSAFIKSRREQTEKASQKTYNKRHTESDGIVRFQTHHFGKSVFSLDWMTFAYLRNPSVRKEEQKVDEWPVPKLSAFWLSVVACIQVVFKTTSFTERILPFVLAWSAPLFSFAPKLWCFLAQ